MNEIKLLQDYKVLTEFYTKPELNKYVSNTEKYMDLKEKYISKKFKYDLVGEARTKSRLDTATKRTKDLKDLTLKMFAEITKQYVDKDVKFTIKPERTTEMYRQIQNEFYREDKDDDKDYRGI